MDLRAVKAATVSELVAAAVAAARNADGLVRDAEILAQAHRPARAYSLAALAVEEVGKGASLATLAAMPQELKERAPVGRMLGWHQLKQAEGQLIAMVPYGPPGLAARLLAKLADELAQLLSALERPAEKADRLKRGGLYLDIDRNGRIREPSEITEAEVADQLERARLAVSAARTILDPGEQDRVARRPALCVELARASFDALATVGYARTPDAASDVVVTVVRTLWARMTGNPVPGAPAASPRTLAAPPRSPARRRAA